ncbi:MAG: GrpB family protein [Rhodoferax sp.]|nr:GrpB family protein [Rhodoferax sp.]
MGAANSDDAPITVVPYCATWTAQFASEALLLQSALRPWLVGDIEHIGSTAVPGLWAKPVIDIMAPVFDLESSWGGNSGSPGGGLLLLCVQGR